MTDNKLICEKRGYHNWENNLFSSGETTEEMEIDVSCNDCGAHGDGTVYWR